MAPLSTLLRASALLPFLLFGCGAPPLGEPFTPPEPRPPRPPPRLAAGDQIEVEYLRAPALHDSYRLSVGDHLHVDLQLHPELSTEVVVAPDGTISYHRVGALHVVGRTVEEARADLTKALAPHFPDPEVTLLLAQGDVQVDKFVSMLETHPAGTLRDVRIEHDGRVSLPGVGIVTLAGLSVADAEELLNRKIHEQFPTLQVSVRTRSLGQDQFTILGEVNKPGRYDVKGNLTLADGLALAGGETLLADLEQVVVIGPPVDDKVQAWLYDLRTALHHGSALTQVPLQPQDTVVVMRSGVGDVNVWIDQWIRRNIPIGAGVNYTLNRVAVFQ